MINNGGNDMFTIPESSIHDSCSGDCQLLVLKEQGLYVQPDAWIEIVGVHIAPLLPFAPICGL